MLLLLLLLLLGLSRSRLLLSLLDCCRRLGGRLLLLGLLGRSDLLLHLLIQAVVIGLGISDLGIQGLLVRSLLGEERLLRGLLVGQLLLFLLKLRRQVLHAMDGIGVLLGDLLGVIDAVDQVVEVVGVENHVDHGDAAGLVGGDNTLGEQLTLVRELLLGLLDLGVGLLDLGVGLVQRRLGLLQGGIRDLGLVVQGAELLAGGIEVSLGHRIGGHGSEGERGAQHRRSNRSGDKIPATFHGTLHVKTPSTVCVSFRRLVRV